MVDGSASKTVSFQMTDVSSGLENVPIEMAPILDDETMLFKKYTAENVASADYIHDPSELTLDGCDCAVLSCGTQCPCVKNFGQNYDASGCLLAITSNACLPYTKPTFECNGSCRCSDTCKNRVVQNGINIKLEVYMTNSKGLGLRAVQDIRKGQFVCEYAGEILDKSEAKSRTDMKLAEDMNYLLILKEHAGKDTEVTYIDPTYIGNVGRYINHSCMPNLEVVPVRVNNKIPRAALFAKRDIPNGEELSYSYHGELQLTQNILQNSKPCLCESDKCTKYLPHNLFAF